MEDKRLMVTCNGNCIAAALYTKADVKRWIKENVIYTHMGTLVTTKTGYRYDTTIGEYYEFKRK